MGVCTGPNFKKKKKKNPTEDFSSFFFLDLTLEITKTSVYSLSNDINGEANVAIDPSFRGLLPGFYCPPGTQRLGLGSSEGRRPSLRQRQCRARGRVHRG